MNKRLDVNEKNINEVKDEVILALIACYGQAWNPRDLDCQRCIAQPRCLHRLSMISLPQQALELGAYDADHEFGTLTPRIERLNLDELASEGEWTTTEALSYAVKYAKDQNIGLPILDGNGVLVPSMKGPPKFGEREVKEEKMEVKNEDKELDDLKAVLETFQEDPQLVETAEEPIVPQPKVKKSKEKKVKKTKVTQTRTKRGSDENFAKRFAMDCEKYDLEFGQKITKEYKNEVHVIEKTKNGYLYKEEYYPTLLAASMKQGNVRELEMKPLKNGLKREGTKTTSNMSANRWFTELKFNK